MYVPKRSALFKEVGVGCLKHWRFGAGGGVLEEQTKDAGGTVSFCGGIQKALGENILPELKVGLFLHK
jgi:hypothetical protein